MGRNWAQTVDTLFCVLCRFAVTDEFKNVLVRRVDRVQQRHKLGPKTRETRLVTLKNGIVDPQSHRSDIFSPLGALSGDLLEHEAPLGNGLGDQSRDSHARKRDKGQQYRVLWHPLNTHHCRSA